MPFSTENGVTRGVHPSAAWVVKEWVVGQLAFSELGFLTVASVPPGTDVSGWRRHTIYSTLPSKGATSWLRWGRDSRGAQRTTSASATRPSSRASAWGESVVPCLGLRKRKAVSRQQEESTLATLLRHHQEEIAVAWAEKMHELPGTRYAEHSVSEMRAWLLPVVAAAIETLSTGSYEATEVCLREVWLACVQMGFDVSEVIEGLLTLREAARSVVQQACLAGSAKIDRAMTALDTYLRFVVGRFGHLYTEAMQTELRRSEERFRTIADFTYDWQYWIDPDGSYVYVSPSCERITGYRADEFRKNPDLLERIIHPDDCATVTEHLRGEPLENSQAHFVEFRVITRGGQERWLEHVCQPVYGSGGDYLGRRASNRDITERKRAEEVLAEQARQKTIAAERSRLARELHDSVTQALYSVTLYAEATRMALSAGKQDVAAKNLTELHRMAREAMVDMRTLIFELHPPVLEEEGLVAAMRARLSAVEARAGLQAEIHVEGEGRVPLPIEEELFWIAMEALNNVVKHAKAQRVEVRCQLEDGNVCLEIQDDGVGFDPAKAGQTGGMGLRGMEERVQRIQGELQIMSAPGRGTTVSVKAEI
jgi:PAS domain S-box-containing protein